jgi:hypothetical protein
MTSKSTSAVSGSGSTTSGSSTSGSGGASVGASVAGAQELMIIASITSTPNKVQNLLFLDMYSSP